MGQYYIIASVIMIEANKIIFPHPKQDQDRQNYLKYIKPNIIFIPKRNQVPIGCICQNIVSPQKHLSSTLTTARTQRQDVPSQAIKIQSSKQLQLNMMKGRHKRSQTKITSIVSARHPGTDENTQTNINTVRTTQPEKFAHQVISKRIKANLNKNRSKFQSDEIFREERSEEFENGGRIQTVRISNKVHNKFLFEASPTAQLWKYEQQETTQSTIPCLYFQSSHYSNKIMLYFHGNGEDLTGCHTFLKHLSTYTQISVLAVEYPGYSLYEGSPSSESIENDGREVMDFLCHQIGFDPRNIMVIGRSIGSGPALHVSSLFEVGGLVLLSPFLSLCEVVHDLYGTFASGLLKQRFNNKERAKEVESPCLIVHGTKDKLISEKHARQLSQYFRGYCTIKIVREMSHSSFSHEEFFAFVSDFQASTDFTN